MPPDRATAAADLAGGFLTQALTGEFKRINYVTIKGQVRR